MKNVIIFTIAILIAGGSGYAMHRYLHPGTTNTNPAIGNQRVEFAAAGLDGKIHNIKDWDGKIVMLNFWATWCPPCVAEMHEIQSLYERWGEKVAFMLVTNEKPDVVKPFMEKHNYLMPVFYLTGTAPPEALSFKALPTTFIISKNGKVVCRKTGAANWDSMATDKIFEELLK